VKICHGFETGKDGFYSSVNKQVRETEPKTKIVRFGGEDTTAKVINMKSVLGSSPGEDVVFRNNNFFFLWYSKIPNDQICDKLLGNKD
jgi:hypothetical protein